MNHRKITNLLVAIALACLWSMIPMDVRAKTVTEEYAEKTKEVQEKQKRRPTTQDRLDAAKRMEELKKKKELKDSHNSSQNSNGLLKMVATFAPAAAIPAGMPNYFGPEPNYLNSPMMRKFVDGLPGLGVANTNNLGQYLPVAVPDTITYPGSDYYEIELWEYSEKMHSDLSPTTLRGYVQVNNGTSASGQNTVAPAPIHYMGPFIVATKDRPVRIKFTNKLPTGTGGNLFLPVDKTVMGAGMGPLDMNTTPGYPMNYTENRATVHLHGGQTPWISDGTPHQWITPAGEQTDYPVGASFQNVPDMTNPGSGSMTFYYTNQQSSRLMFYHDHSFGITRLNVYAGEAAGYIIRDSVEKDLIARGIIPSSEIPLIIQDKTFLPDQATITAKDPTWPFTLDTTKSNLWFPHVYMTNQNPNDIAGVNLMGRWDYGPWIWPPFPTMNPPFTIGGIQYPNLPDISMTMEAFMDTPVINGTAYPTVTVDPKTYRFRILNASDDRFWNLQIIKADPAAPTEVKMVPFGAGTWPAGYPTPDARTGGIPDPTTIGPNIIQIGTEGGFLPAPVTFTNIPIGWDRDTRSITYGNIKEHNLLLGPAERADVIIDFSAYAGQTLILYNDAPAPAPAKDDRVDYYTGNPDLSSIGGNVPTVAGYGPNTRTIMQIKVSNITPSPAFNTAALNSEFASTATTQGVFARGQNPILVPQAGYNTAYNATFPSGTTAYERISDLSLNFNPLDLTQATKLSPTAVTITNMPKAIAEEFESSTSLMAFGRMSGYLGVEVPFTNGMNQTTIWYDFQDPASEIVTQAAKAGVPTSGDNTQIWKVTHNGVDSHAIHFHSFDVQLLNRVDWAGVVKPPEPNELGWKETVRMNPLEDAIVVLRPTVPKTPFALPTSSRYLDPTMPPGSTNFKGVDISGNPITVTNVVTNFGHESMWHCHLLSHEEMDMMRPIIFQPLATSLYVLPGPPTGVTALAGNGQATVSFTAPSSTGGSAITSYVVTSSTGVKATRATSPIIVSGLTNGVLVTFTVAAVNSAGTGLSSLPSNTVTPTAPAAPTAPSGLTATAASSTRINLSWTDNSSNETSFTLHRATDSGFTQNLRAFTIGANVTSYADTTALAAGTKYYYRIRSYNGGGNSAWSNVANATTPVTPPVAPSNLTATSTVTNRIDLAWTDNSSNETGFTIHRATDAGFTQNLYAFTAGTNATAISDASTSVISGRTYYYRVRAYNGGGNSTWSNTASVIAK